MPKRSSIAIFIAATSALAISTADSNSVKSGENDLGGLKEWNTDMPLDADFKFCLLYTSPSPRDGHQSRMPSSA